MSVTHLDASAVLRPAKEPFNVRTAHPNASQRDGRSDRVLIHRAVDTDALGACVGFAVETHPTRTDHVVRTAERDLSTVEVPIWVLKPGADDERARRRAAVCACADVEALDRNATE